MLIRHLTVILTCQLLGEVIVQTLSLPLPGPVLGMTFFLVLLILIPNYANRVDGTAQGLLSHLSLLFVPAGVGILGHIHSVDKNVAIIFFAIFVSTIAAIVVSVCAFVLTAKFLGQLNE